MRQAALLASALLLGACGGSSAEPSPGPEPVAASGGSPVNAERFALCITQRSGSLLTDPLRQKPVEFSLSPALTRQADQPPVVGKGSILPRPAAFAAFGGFDVGFVPAGFKTDGLVPTAFVLFDDSAAAIEHEPDADLRVGNVLMVFARHGTPPKRQFAFINRCLRTSRMS